MICRSRSEFSQLQEHLIPPGWNLTGRTVNFPWTVRLPVGGILPMILAARQEGVQRFFVPRENAQETDVVQRIEIIAVGRLEEAVEMLAGSRQINLSVTDVEQLFRNNYNHNVDFAEVKGQKHAKRAMEIAAAGGHNILST